MKNIFKSALIVLILFSCQRNDDSADFRFVGDYLNNNNQINQEAGEPFEINIDESDLIDLPEDTGGIHTAIPLGLTSAQYGYYAYTPSGYSEDGPEYPVLIFLHGWSPNLGNEPLENVLLGGPPRLIERGQWKPNHPFIVISPQLKSPVWVPISIHRFIEHLLERYQINPSRIYLTGLSLGGGGCWFYAGEIKDNYAAAIVPISASGAEYLVENLREVPIWAFHGARDNTVDAYQNFGSVPMVRAINETNPKTKARITVYPNVGHNAWTTTYNGSARNHNQSFDSYDVDLYDWMLSHKKE